ncbi:hypothetical protein PGC08_13140 [Brevibacterium sp. BDJS002]|uniref:hypothetical protein n=1 Tax=Brevibacterium sp. BDJS002 TaxID=3020906 RepID=UPI0023077D48|nr:hypothetical protein [Brevibacterium sp. BDJS002]MDN5759879.1 hypothetical protein [Tomitella sp.]WCE38948.1 hypothetical protein PGC08_13140 [Brevibacterium sp. BDJS002]
MTTTWPMAEDEWLDVAATAERHDCSTKSIWRRVWKGKLPARTEKVGGRDGRPVIKTLIRVSHLDRAFGLTAHAEHVQKIREAAPPLTREQTTFIAKVFTDHLLEQDAKRRREGEAGTAS